MRITEIRNFRSEEKTHSHKQSADNRKHITLVKPAVLPDVNAKHFIPDVSQNKDNRQDVFPAIHKVPRPTIPPPNRQPNNAA